jgi:hypothetical protein
MSIVPGIPVWGDATQMFGISTQLLAKAELLVTELAANQFYTPYIVGANYPTTSPPPTPLLPGPPSLQEVIWTVPMQPGAFTQAPPSIANLFPGEFTGVEPTLNFGTIPQPKFGSVPQSPGVDLNFTYPTPNISLPSVPTLLSLDTIPFDPDAYTIPDFTGTVPTLSLISPNIINFVEPPAYTSQLLDDMLADLNNAITDDNATGLTAATQQAMWDAAREREYRSMDDQLEALNRDQELLGYALPSGVWNANRLKIYTEMHNTSAGLSRDIMVKQAEMRLDNVMKCRELSITLERDLMEQHNNVAQRVFEAAKYETEAAISIYNANVEVFKARIEGFRATIEVYTAQIEGIKARVAVLNAEIQFEQTKAQINTALVEQYKAQVDASLAVLEVAKVQVEIIQTQAQVEKTKVDIFSAQVQAFVSTVNAYTAEVEAYKANAEAQGVIESAYKTQVDAYVARVQAGTAQATAFIEGYKAQVTGYEAQLEGYKASLGAMVEQARAASEFNQSATAEYTANVQALSAYNEALISEWKAILDEGLQIAQVEVKVAEANSQLAISQRSLTIEAIKGAASVMSQLGAAALGAIHWSNSAQWSVSDPGTSHSFANNTSTSYDHVYSASV